MGWTTPIILELLFIFIDNIDTCRVEVFRNPWSILKSRMSHGLVHDHWPNSAYVQATSQMFHRSHDKTKVWRDLLPFWVGSWKTSMLWVFECSSWSVKNTQSTWQSWSITWTVRLHWRWTKKCVVGDKGPHHSQGVKMRQHFSIDVREKV